MDVTAHAVKAGKMEHAAENPAQSSLRLKVTHLPLNCSTWDIHNFFSQYGTLVRITIDETRSGDRSSSAEIDFQPRPVECFWPRRLSYQNATGSGPFQVIHVQEAYRQKHWYPVPSPGRLGVKYNQLQEVVGSCLDFGFLKTQDCMTIMRSCPTLEGSRPRLILNFAREEKEIEICFSITQTSPQRSSVRDFRFKIALDDALKLWQLDNRTIVIHLPRPPWYSKQLKEAVDKSHSKDGRLWSIEDTWARQTDIVDLTGNVQKIAESPISVHKDLNFINTARWTTFRFHVHHSSLVSGAASSFLNALQDWNVKIQPGDDFKIDLAEPTLDQDTWSLINSINRLPFSSLQGLQMASLHLSFAVRYQLEVCLSHGYLCEYSLSHEFFTKLAMWQESTAKQALVHLATSQNRLFDPMDLFTDIQYLKPVRAKKLPENCVEIHSATVTASGILFHTPSVEITNRVIRRYQSQAHRFLRVHFEDDLYRGKSKLFATTNNRMITVFNRVKRALTQGINIGDIHYEFLAWGNSQLRDHSVYFVAPTAELAADKIREQMGSFDETVVAKKAARMGQCFSTTRAVRRLTLQRIRADATIDDVKRNEYTFTDGVGKISSLAAYLVAQELGIKGRTPSLFQFRLGGCKGVLVSSKDVPGIGMQIRKSQFKFDSLSGDLEIIRYSQFWQPFLNRQIILLLRHLGVPDAVFLQMQNETILSLKEAMEDDEAAVRALRSNVDPNLMTLNICELIEPGFRNRKEPFVMALLHLWRSWSLKYLKEKAKIPVGAGAFVLGCVDETASLKGHTNACPRGDRDEIVRDPKYLENLPEIFIQITDPTTNECRIIEGLCIIARNPSLHQGDIRVVRAVDCPALRDNVDVVVMPQTGERDLPSMCSGGDLDGDDYIVIWDEKLIPKTWNAEPFHYKPATPKTVTSDITTKDLIDFFLDYLRFDALGRIAVAHLAAADALDDGIESDICQELTQLHSNAVDYPKTGVPAIMPRRLDRDKWPHFMEKRSKSYKSRKILGQLYDSVEQVKFRPDYDLPFDERILKALEPTRRQFKAMEDLKAEYDSALRRILTQHAIKSEFELWSTFVLEHSKKSRDYKFHEEVGELSRVLKEQYFEAICDTAGGKGFAELAPYAVAAYTVTQRQVIAANSEKQALRKRDLEDDDNHVDEIEDNTRMPFISFPWLLQDTLRKLALFQEDKIGSRKKVSTTQESEQNAVWEGRIGERDNSSTDLPEFADLNLQDISSLTYLPDPLKAGLAESSGRSDAYTENVLGLKASPAEEQSNINSTMLEHESKLRSSADQQSSGFFMIGDFSEGGEVYETTQEGVQEEKQADVPDIRDHGTLASRLNRRDRRGKDLLPMCHYWKTYGSCQFEDSKCRFAHYYTGVQPRRKEQVTCWFWLTTGHCSKTDERCQLAHKDTGITTPPPALANTITSTCISTKSADEVIRAYQGRRYQPSSTKGVARRLRAPLDDSEDEQEVGSASSHDGNSMFNSVVVRSADEYSPQRQYAAVEDLVDLDFSRSANDTDNGLNLEDVRKTKESIRSGEASPIVQDIFKQKEIHNKANQDYLDDHIDPFEHVTNHQTSKQTHPSPPRVDPTEDLLEFSVAGSSVSINGMRCEKLPIKQARSEPAIRDSTQSETLGEVQSNDTEQKETMLYGDPFNNDEFEVNELSD